MIKMVLRSSFATLLSYLFIFSCVFAESTFPTPTDNYINDYAKVLKSADIKSISELLKSVRSQTGAEITLVTLNSIYDYADKNETLESYATELFNHWGIGKKETNNGVLILFALKDRKVRIELGSGFGAHYNEVMKQVIDEKMIPHFKDKDYSRGLYEGTQGVRNSITTPVSWYKFYWKELAIGGLIIICLLAGISCMRSGKKGWGWAFFAMAGALLTLLFFLARLTGKGGGSGFGGGSSKGGGASGSW